MSCKAPEANGVLHADLGGKFCQFCGQHLRPRDSDKKATSIELLVINDDDTVTATKSSWKPNKRSKTRHLSDDADNNNRSEADKHARVPRRPAPHPLIKKESTSMTKATYIPAASEIDRDSSTEFFLQAARQANAAREKSATSNPPDKSNTQFYHFNITVCRGKWIRNDNDRLPIPVYLNKSFEMLHNYETAIRKTPISNITDWWERLASVPFIRKKEMERAYPSVAFYKSFTASSFTDLDMQAVQAKNIRTIWTSLNSSKAKADGKEHRRIFVCYQDLEVIPLNEADTVFETSTKEETKSAEDKPAKIKLERGVKREATGSPIIKRSGSTDSLRSLSHYIPKKSSNLSPESVPRTPTPRTPTPRTPTPRSPTPLTPTPRSPLRTKPLESVEGADSVASNSRDVVASSSKEIKIAPIRVSSRSTKAIPARRFDE
ncbi:hypothetical protein F4811DRAFT_503340 [Daldinia bambusicola]|nr:hypothetical protein F4811DRAFT_503340 [Daldinia bambusicola]